MKKAFTLIELLVSISIIGLLIGLMVGGLNKSRQTAQMRICGINLKQLHTATAGYTNDNKEIYPFADSTASLYSGYTKPFSALESYLSVTFPHLDNNRAKSSKPYLCPSDKMTNGFSYIYAPYDLMASWPSIDPQYAVSKVLMNTPLEPLFLDSDVRHKIGTGESLLISCDGSIVIREGKKKSPF